MAEGEEVVVVGLGVETEAGRRLVEWMISAGRSARAVDDVLLEPLLKVVWEYDIGVVLIVQGVERYIVN